MADEDKKTGTPRVKREPVPGEVTPETKAEQVVLAAAAEEPVVVPDESLAVFSRNNRCTYKSQMIKAGEKFYLDKESHFNAKIMMWVVERPRVNKHGKVLSATGKAFVKTAYPNTFRKAMQDLAE